MKIVMEKRIRGDGDENLKEGFFILETGMIFNNSLLIVLKKNFSGATKTGGMR